MRGDLPKQSDMWSGDAPANNKSRDTFTFGLAIFRIVANDKDISLDDKAIQIAWRSLEAMLSGLNSVSDAVDSIVSMSSPSLLYRSSLRYSLLKVLSWNVLETCKFATHQGLNEN